MKFRTVLVPLTMPLVLAACLGGGGGGGGSSSGQSGPLTLDSTPTAFTSFDDITANSLVEADAASSVNYRAATAGGIPDRSGTLTFEGSSVRLLSGDPSDPLDPTSDPEFGGLRLSVDDPAIVRDFEADPTAVGAGAAASRYVAYEIDDGGVTDRLTVDDPNNDAFDYMTFGLWEVDIGEASMDIGGAAWGAATPTAGATSMPTTGGATYTGDLIGYNVVDGGSTTVVATSTLDVDFTGGGAVELSSSGTVDLAGDDFSFLDITTTSAGTIDDNTFDGTDITLVGAGPELVGSSGGSFFGPNAEEAGGWFEIRNTAAGPNLNDRYFGSFGGTSVP